MTTLSGPDSIVRWRAAAQRLVGTPLADTAEVVGHLLAVQAQDFGPAGWSVAQRCAGLTEREFLAAFNAGEVVRTHVLRPTWHLVRPDDLRWLLALTAPRVHQANGHLYRSLALDAALLERAGRVVCDTLEGTACTRRQLAGVLAAHGIEADGQRLAYVMMYAELEQLVCSGPRAGRQHTYQRFDDRVPATATPFDRDLALRDLVVRYLAGHGPATAHELARWSSLTLADVRAGVEAAGDTLDTVTVDGHIFHAAGAAARVAVPAPWVLLAQPYDEVLTSSTSGVNLNDRAGHLDGGWPRFSALVLVGGQVAGSWRRTVRTRTVEVDVALFDEPSEEVRAGLDAEASRLATYHDVPTAHVAFVPP